MWNFSKLTSVFAKKQEVSIIEDDPFSPKAEEQRQKPERDKLKMAKVNLISDKVKEFKKLAQNDKSIKKSDIFDFICDS